MPDLEEVSQGTEAGGSGSSRETESSLDSAFSEPHKVVPDRFLLTTGLVILSAPTGSNIRVGLIPPGSWPGTEVCWRAYSPGRCCLCGDKCFELLQEGISGELNKELRKSLTPSDKAYELAGPCRVTWCRKCFDQSASLYLAVRKDTHEGPCVCGITDNQDIKLCHKSPIHRVEPVTLLAYRSCRRDPAELWKYHVDLWNIPCNVQARRYTFINSARLSSKVTDWVLKWDLTTVGELCNEVKSERDTPRSSIHSFTHNQSQVVWTPPVTNPRKWDWITSGSVPERFPSKRVTRDVKTFQVMGYSEVLGPYSQPETKILTVVVDQLMVPQPTQGNSRQGERIAFGVQMVVQGNWISTSTGLKMRPRQKRVCGEWLAEWIRRVNEANDSPVLRCFCPRYPQPHPPEGRKCKGDQVEPMDTFYGKHLHPDRLDRVQGPVEEGPEGEEVSYVANRIPLTKEEPHKSKMVNLFSRLTFSGKGQKRKSDESESPSEDQA